MDETTPKKVSILEKLPLLSSFLLGLATFFVPFLSLNYHYLFILRNDYDLTFWWNHNLFTLPFFISYPLAIFSFVMMFVYYRLLRTNRVKKLVHLILALIFSFICLYMIFCFPFDLYQISHPY